MDDYWMDRLPRTTGPRRYEEAEDDQFGNSAENEGRSLGEFDHSEGSVKRGAPDDYSARGLFGDENYSRDSYGYGDAAINSHDYDGPKEYRSFDLYSEAGESSFSVHNAEGVLEEEPAIGPYSGIGPGYEVYSDERLREIVSDAIADHPEIDASGFSVKVKNGEVYLEGYVASIEMKRYIDWFVSDIRGVQDVQVNLKVNKEA